MASLSAAFGLAQDYGASFDPSTNVQFPKSDWVVNVREAPYRAQGDGVTDDSLAIQQAIDDVMGEHRVLYFSEGTYLISKTLNWSNRNSNGKPAWGHNWIAGQGATKTTLRLKDGVFGDPSKPQSMMWCGGFGSADWFHNYVEDLTFDVGENNPGAIALQFYSNNYGAVRNVRLIDRSTKSAIGLHLGHRDMNGPLLIKNCAIFGFRVGIQSALAVNSQTLENITLREQSEVGFSNEGQTISIRGLLSTNRVPAIKTYGTMATIESKLEGLQGAENAPAVINYNGGRIYVRDCQTSGYRRALASLATPDAGAAYRMTDTEQPAIRGPDVREFSSTDPTNPSSGSNESLRLPIRPTPTLNWESPAKWANAVDFGADPTGIRDSSEAIQRAIDSGASTVFVPGFMVVQHTVLVRGNVQRIIGTGGWVDYTSQCKPDFRIVDGTSAIVQIEHLSSINGGIEIDTQRTVVLKSLGVHLVRFTDRCKGMEVFFEDVTTGDLQLHGHKMWARQLNIENEGTHLTNDASNAWILGYKTERGGTLLQTQNGGRSEILGGFSYTTTAGKLAPMFVTRDADVFAYFGEICYSGVPYVDLIDDIQRGAKKRLVRGEGDTLPYVSRR